MKRRTVQNICFITAVISVVVACSTQKRIAALSENNIRAEIQLAEAVDFIPDISDVKVPQRDTIKIIDDNGNEIRFMAAMRDEETGEMVATEELAAAVVTARFRNIAERHGKVDIAFQVIVPAVLMDTKWQVRFHPDMYILGDSLRLDDVVITGRDYRKEQLRGYERYERWLAGIITDSSMFYDLRNLEIFLERNLPAIYAMKNDSSYVSAEEFAANFGVTQQEAIEHYTRRMLMRRNARLVAQKESRYKKMVIPIVTEGIRLDTVIADANGNLVYNYIQTINTQPKLRKVDVCLSGEVFEHQRRIYRVPQSDPLTFYISSVSAFTENIERFLHKVVSRKATSTTEANIDFAVGKSNIDESFAGNAGEIARVKSVLREILESTVYDLDSITIVASASPEGSFHANEALSKARAKSVSDYFDRYIRFAKDSIVREQGMFITIGDDMEESGMTTAGTRDIRFITRSGGENWDRLAELVLDDDQLLEKDKYDYVETVDVKNADERERRLSARPYYGHIRKDLYPKLRTVSFRFALSRKGMVKDTVMTTEPDTAYARGIQLVNDHDYEQAIGILAPYRDINTAIAYLALDRNQNAFDILSEMERTAKVNYMLALIYSRWGDDQNAVQCYTKAVAQDASYVSRGNLDPEISVLIKRYNLNAQPDDDEWGDLGF